VVAGKAVSLGQRGDDEDVDDGEKKAGLSGGKRADYILVLAVALPSQVRRGRHK
jgi:hypothetical protein